jgi:hypothetical protein
MPALVKLPPCGYAHTETLLFSKLSARMQQRHCPAVARDIMHNRTTASMLTASAPQPDESRPVPSLSVAPRPWLRSSSQPQATTAEAEKRDFANPLLSSIVTDGQVRMQWCIALGPCPSSSPLTGWPEIAAPTMSQILVVLGCCSTPKRHAHMGGDSFSIHP